MKKMPAWLKRFINMVNAIFRKFSVDCVFAYAAQASFFVVISSIPLLMLVLSFIQFFLPIDRVQVVSALEAVLPDSVFDFAVTVVDELFGKTDVSVVSVTAVTLLWTASSGIRSISEGVRNVYQVRFCVPYVKKYFRSIADTAFFIVFILLNVGVLLFGNFLFDWLVRMLHITAELGELLIAARSGIFLILLTVVFTLLFYSLSRPGTHMKLKEHFPGAVFAAIGWLGFSWIYSIYINSFSNYSYIYGSLTAIVLLMLWLYMCMVILLAGAELNVWCLGRNPRSVSSDVQSKSVPDAEKDSNGAKREKKSRISDSNG